jgi:DNA-binding response OmpR family regulator
MLDAWIYATDDGDAAEIAHALAELGYSPRRTCGANGSLAPSGADGSPPRRPGLAVVVGAAGEPAPVEVFRRLRGDERLGDVPVVMALGPEHLESAGPLAEADELIVRPFTPPELGLRIARARREANGVGSGDVVRHGTLELDLAKYQAAADGQPLHFTYVEYELLKFFMTHPNRVFSREALLTRVWGYDYYGGARTVDVHVRRVRAKLGPEHAARLKTIRSVGYRFET